MKLISTNEKVFNWLGILNIEKNPSKQEKIRQIMSSVGIIVYEICTMMSSVAFIYKNISTNLEVCLFGVLQVVGSVGLTYMITSALIQRSKIAVMFQILSNLNSESKNLKFFNIDFSFLFFKF